MEATAAQAAVSLEQLAAEVHELQLRVERLERGAAPACSNPKSDRFRRRNL